MIPRSLPLQLISYLISTKIRFRTGVQPLFPYMCVDMHQHLRVDTGVCWKFFLFSAFINRLTHRQTYVNTQNKCSFPWLAINNIMSSCSGWFGFNPTNPYLGPYNQMFKMTYWLCSLHPRFSWVPPQFVHLLLLGAFARWRDKSCCCMVGHRVCTDLNGTLSSWRRKVKESFSLSRDQCNN